MELTVDQALELGVAAHKEGKLQEAERLYRSILQTQPKHPNVNHNLGVLAASLNRFEAALPFFKTAVEVNPTEGLYWISYIDALIKANQFENARQVLKKAKKMGLARDKLDALSQQLTSAADDPAPSQSELNILLAHYQNGRYDDAEKLAISISEKFPNSQFSWKVLGVVLKNTGRISEALVASQKAVGIDPKDAEAHNNLGLTLRELGRLEEAEASYRKAIALKPHFAEAHSNLGITLRDLGRLEEAEASNRQAIALKPDFAEAHNNLGNTLQEVGRLEEAEASYRKAIALRPDFVEAISGLGVAFIGLNKRDDAVVNFKKSHDLIRGKNPVDPFHKSFLTISKAKMDHDIEQFKYLADSGYEVEKFQALAKLYTDVSLEIDWPVEEIQFALSNKYQKLLKETYNRPINVIEAPVMRGGALSDTLEREKITKDYFKHDHGLTYIDNFLTPSTLNSIRKFLLGSTIWFDLFHKGGYLGAYLEDGLACPLLLQIADDLRSNFPGIFKNHQLKQLWAYKYDSRAYKNNNGLTGIEPHADFAAVNVNFWITPAVANLNPESGGLIVHNTPAPLGWDFKTYNLNQGKLLKHLEDSSSEKSIVPYNENRVVIFNSNLIHETDRFEFKEGYENRRINVTMLFGYRRD